MQRGTVVTIVGLLVLAAIFVGVSFAAEGMRWLNAAAIVVAIGAAVVLLLRYNTQSR